MASRTEQQVSALLSGSRPKELDPAIAAAYKSSRANEYAAREDIKEINAKIVTNPSRPVLVEAALRAEKGSSLTSTGALAVFSGAKTGRSPKDKRLVVEDGSKDNVWWGPVNIGMSEDAFMINRERALDYLNFGSPNRERTVYVIDGYAGWDSRHRINVRVICYRAYHALFMKNMLVEPTAAELETFEPGFTILNAGGFPANRFVDGMTSSCSVDLHLGRMEMVILGTQYAGEMKKGILTLMMYLMPLHNQLCLHSSCNEDDDGNVALFFGLSGTGKTTLSADPQRHLIGDDEHVWTDDGCFNVEGGCYAKCAGLSAATEPEIYGAVRFGSVVENVAFDEGTHEVDYEDTSITENTRCAYPLQYIPNAKLPALGGHPKNVILLTCDGYGVLPPVSRLSKEQVIYHFLAGYTSKMAGTEVGITKPTAAFSSCYGEPFLVWHPAKYAHMLADRLEHHDACAWLVNTGWIGGAGSDGRRCPLKYTRAIVTAIHNGELRDAQYVENPIFKLKFPKEVTNVPSEILCPATNWKDPAEYEKTALGLATLFKENFEKYADMVGPEIVAAGPITGNPYPVPLTA